MASRYRTNLVIKLFPSVPRGLFGKGKHAQRLTDFLEQRVFYREFQVSAFKAGVVLVAAGAIAAWSVIALALSLHAVLHAAGVRADANRQQARLEDSERSLRAMRRGYYMLLSRLQPLNEDVDRLASFSAKLALVAGIDTLAAELETSASERSLDIELSEQEVLELDRRFEQLATVIENQHFELARTPSISPLRAAFVPTDRFGYRANRFTNEPVRQARGGDGRHFHAGLDLAAPEGTPIHATADGEVHFAGSIPPRQDAGASFYGNFVVLDHGNGIRSVFAHCDRIAVETGRSVRRGDVIAWVGSTGRSTGPHLHYEVVVNGRPVDPELFVLDVALPDKRVRVDFDDTSLLIDEVDELLKR